MKELRLTIQSARFESEDVGIANISSWITKGMGLMVSLVMLCTAVPSYGFFDAQALVGKRKGDVGNTAVSGDELTLAAHLDPIPLVPVAFGLSLSHVNFSGKNDPAKLSFDDIVGQEYVAEVMAWVPIGLFGFKPYGKLGYTVGGNYKLKDVVDPNSTPSTNPEDYTYTPSGTHLSIGLKWSPLPLIGILAEYKMSNQELKKSGRPTSKYETNSLLFGVEVGI